MQGIIRKGLKCMGASKYDLGLNRPRIKRGPYKKMDKYDTAGRVGKEMRVMVGFWRTYKVADVMTWTQEELDQKLNLYFEEYEAKQLKNNKRWWYPEAVDFRRFK